MRTCSVFVAFDIRSGVVSRPATRAAALLRIYGSAYPLVLRLLPTQFATHIRLVATHIRRRQWRVQAKPNAQHDQLVHPRRYSHLFANRDFERRSLRVQLRLQY